MLLCTELRFHAVNDYIWREKKAGVNGNFSLRDTARFGFFAGLSKETALPGGNRSPLTVLRYTLNLYPGKQLSC